MTTIWAAMKMAVRPMLQRRWNLNCHMHGSQSLWQSEPPTPPPLPSEQQSQAWSQAGCEAGDCKYGLLPPRPPFPSQCAPGSTPAQHHSCHTSCGARLQIGSTCTGSKLEGHAKATSRVADSCVQAEQGLGALPPLPPPTLPRGVVQAARHTSMKRKMTTITQNSTLKATCQAWRPRWTAHRGKGQGKG